MEKIETTVWSIDGKKAGNISLPSNIFSLPWNADLVKQVVDSILSSKRKNIAHTKNRGEVSGGGKKPWKQKGTGRARHGSTRSPIWVKGGVAHGPRNEKNYDRTVSRKMKAKALHTLLSKKFREGEILFVDKISLEAKTKKAIESLNSLSKISGFENLFSKKKNSAVIALSSKDVNTEKAFRNLGQVLVVETRNINPTELLQYKYLVLENPDSALKSIPKMPVRKKSK